jgi:hypothetical protein
MRMLLAAGLVLLPAFAASAQSPNDGGKTDASKKICKVDPEDTDSRIRRRVCKTEAEWNGRSDDVKSETDRSPNQAQ